MTLTPIDNKLFNIAKPIWFEPDNLIRRSDYRTLYYEIQSLTQNSIWESVTNTVWHSAYRSLKTLFKNMPNLITEQ